MDRIYKTFRIDSKTLEKLEQIARNNRYYTVHATVNCILDAVVDGFDNQSISNMLHYVRDMDKPNGKFSVTNL